MQKLNKLMIPYFIDDEGNSVAVYPKGPTTASNVAEKIFDTAQMSTFAKELKEKATELDECIDNMFQIIDSMPAEGAWSGPSYDSFLERCNKYRDSLNSYVELIGAYATEISHIHEKTEEAVSKIKRYAGGVM